MTSKRATAMNRHLPLAFSGVSQLSYGRDGPPKSRSFPHIHPTTTCRISPYGRLRKQKLACHGMWPQVTQAS